jgi:DNA-binding transcriptional ArsR family regulator
VPTEDAVFRALADPSRRRLLDTLFADDGQSLGQLCAALPSMTRFGVMKHLALLEQAGLVVTHREGRTKLHYLNPVPIREIHDRWISKYARTTTEAMVGLRRRAETA